MTHKSILVFAFLFFSSTLIAQEKLVVNADRPDQTDAAYTIEKGYLQLETGLFLQHSTESKTFGLPSVLLRLGMWKNLELRLSGLLVNEKEKTIPSNTGIQSSEVGFKLNLVKQRKILPATSLTSSVTLPFLFSKPFKTGLVQNTTKFLLSNDLNKTTQVGYNTGVITIKHAKPIWFYTISLGEALNKELSCFIESYSFFQSTAKPDFNFDSGFSYSFSDLFVTDIAAGFSASNSQSYFITIGFTWLFPGKIF
jgi:hypothetical protein